VSLPCLAAWLTASRPGWNGRPVRSALTDTYKYGIIVCMRTTLNIDDGVLQRASELTGVREKTALVRMGLESLIAERSAQRLAALGGAEPGAKPIPRRRPKR
jgi:hypothetical protein